MPLVVQGPGWGPSVEYLRATLVPLFLERYRVLSYDVRGAGENRSASGPFDIDSRVVDLATVTDRPGFRRFFLLAHSHGASIAVRFAREFPSRLAGLVLVTPGLGPRPTGAGAADLLAAWAIDRHRSDAVAAFREGPGALPGDRQLARYMRRVLPIHFASLEHLTTFVEKVRDAGLPASAVYRQVIEEAAETDLRGVSAPMLLISGRQDPLVPPALVEEAAADAGATRHVVFESSGHHPWVEEPRRFNEVVDRFLEGLAPESGR